MTSRFRRGLAVIGTKGKYNATTSEERTKEMMFADSERDFYFESLLWRREDLEEQRAVRIFADAVRVR